MKIANTISIIILSAILAHAQSWVVADAPEVRDAFTLTASYDADEGHNALFFNGKAVPPTIRVLSGASIKLEYVNNLPVHSSEQCALERCENHSNLHFHGLHVSPESPQDDVLTMMATPGERLSYRVEIPSYAAPGLYWYHTHAHGESARQALDGMSGAIIVEGIDRYYPQVREMRERVLVLRGYDIEGAKPEVRHQLFQQVSVPATRCGTAPDNQGPERIFTLNGEIRPQIPINPGERQFWRIVNASPDRYADLDLGGQLFEIIALDGMPLNYHNRTRQTLKVDHILVAPGGRVEAIVTGPPASTRPTLSTRCVDTGPDGDVNSGMVIADLVRNTQTDSPSAKSASTTVAPIYKEFSRSELEKLEASAPDFTVVFTEDKSGFYINGKNSPWIPPRC